MDDRLLTYPELAEALGRSEEAVRQLAKRRRWHRVISNEDGRARVAVPVEVLNAPRPPADRGSTDQVSGRLTGERPEDDRDDDQEDALTVVVLLQGQIARLETDLERAMAGLDEARAALAIERIRAAQVDVLQALLEAERRHAAAEKQHIEAAQEEARQRADELRADRDRWAGLAEAHQRQLAEIQAGTTKSTWRWWPKRRA